MKKRLISLILALMLVFALSAVAFAGAETAVLSSQKLAVNGVDWSEVEKYNIDGKNYFKLRDIAALLDDTEAHFAVGYDVVSNTVSITRGGVYEYIGTELLFTKDNSSTAVTSAQTITVDGRTVSNLTVYNIGGSNFFQLRELGDLLGFDVDYNSETRTMLVESPYLPYDQYVIAKETYTSNGTNGTKVYEYDANGREIRVTTTEAGTVSTAETTYNAKGLVTSEKSYVNGSLSEKTIYEYDSYGNETRCDYDHISSGYYTRFSAAYRADGQMTWMEYSDSDGLWTRSNYTYDAAGNKTKAVTDYGSSVTTTTYTRDSAGRVIKERDVYSDGGWCETNYIYSGGYVTRTSLTTSDGYSHNMTYRYDANGNMTYIKSSDSDGYETTTTYAYNADGLITKQVDTQQNLWGDGSTTTTEYTYNDIGQELSVKTTDSNGGYSLATYKYDSNYNLIEAKYAGPYNTFTYTYTYDENFNTISSTVTGTDGTSERHTYEWKLVTIKP